MSVRPSPRVSRAFCGPERLAVVATARSSCPLLLSVGCGTACSAGVTRRVSRRGPPVRIRSLALPFDSALTRSNCTGATSWAAWRSSRTTRHSSSPRPLSVVEPLDGVFNTCAAVVEVGVVPVPVVVGRADLQVRFGANGFGDSGVPGHRRGWSAAYRSTSESGQCVRAAARRTFESSRIRSRAVGPRPASLRHLSPYIQSAVTIAAYASGRATSASNSATRTARPTSSGVDARRRYCYEEYLYIGRLTS